MKKARMPIYGQVSDQPNAWIVTNNRRNGLSNDRGRKKIYPNNLAKTSSILVTAIT